jgi:2-hydroxychromene-2-carboxylate isomerase
MSARVDFYFDVVCPYAYLAHTQIEALAERAGAALEWKPILLGGLFRSIGAGDGPMPGMPAEKARMNLCDMHRWAEHWGVPLEMPAGHPSRTVLAMRALLASGDSARAAKALFAAYWQEGRDLSDERAVARALDEAGLDGTALVARASSDAAIKDELRRRTDEAAAAGAFGVPTFVVARPGRAPELFWGQDRLLFVEKALSPEREELAP